MRSRHALAFFLTLSACGAFPGDLQPVEVVRDSVAHPEDVARSCLEAVRRGDAAALHAVLTDEARVGAGSDASARFGLGHLDAFTLGTPVVADGKARVPASLSVDGESRRMTVLLKREEKCGCGLRERPVRPCPSATNAPWRVYGIEVPTDGGGHRTLDFESPERTPGS